MIYSDTPPCAITFGIKNNRNTAVHSDCRKRCVHPLAPSARGLRPQAVGERTVRLSEIFRAMARFSPSAPSGHLPRRGRFFDTLKSRPEKAGAFLVLGQYRIILSADTASEVPQPPERCLSRKAGIMRCCLSYLCGLSLRENPVRRVSAFHDGTPRKCVCGQSNAMLCKTSSRPKRGQSRRISRTMIY